MSPSATRSSTVSVVVPKRVTIGALVAVAVAMGGGLLAGGWHASSANGRITALEKDVAPIDAINERTIRIEEQVKAIRDLLAARPRP